MATNYNFSKEEEKILRYWIENQIFQKSLDSSSSKPTFYMYEGPPFATGSPHYGHILTGTIKDCVCRMASMMGYHVPRVSGFDTHGLPIEQEIEKTFGIKSKSEVMEFGLANYNKECRNIVLRCEDEWKTTITRMARFLDWDNGYKTMDKSFMESVWKVFARLFEKGLVYKGFRVMPYSTALTTPISNFEANQNYKDVHDKTVYVKFETTLGTMLVWTTTPWTLFSNQALCVNPELTYVKVECNGEEYILAESRIADVFKELIKKKNKVNILQKMLGAELVGHTYNPLFAYNPQKTYRILGDSFVTDSSGTGIVHISPAFGADDFDVSVKNGVIQRDGTDMFMPIDDNANYTITDPKYCGKLVFDCDSDIIKDLKESGALFKQSQHKHSYPFCWRSDTKLIYRAVTSWFVKTTDIREQLLEANRTINWVPAHIGAKRFHNWLENVRDWNISRNRYWGCPIPIWESEDGTETVIIDSVEKLEKMAKLPTGTISDLHKENIDHITFMYRGKLMRRIPEVFDCWFESGSMPFAQTGTYRQADFICEGIDQTRGWFYTLLVLGVALNNETPFKNVIVNGFVLAKDGRKMSKRLKNYTGINDIINKYGADSLRFYLLNSTCLKAESLRFKDTDLFDITKKLLVPFKNSLKFYQEHIINYQNKYGTRYTEMESDNPTDCWIKSRMVSLKNQLMKSFKSFNLNKATNHFFKMVDDLNNWYIKFNRSRIKCLFGKEEGDKSLTTLRQCLKHISVLIAPFCPYFAEYLYQSVEQEDKDKNKDKDYLSVHLYQWCDLEVFNFDQDLERQFSLLQTTCDMIRKDRGKYKLNMRRPISKVMIYSDNLEKINDLRKVEQYLKDEMKILKIRFKLISDLMVRTYKFNYPKYGRTMGKFAKKIMSRFNVPVINGHFKNGYQFQYKLFTIVVGDHIITEYKMNSAYNYTHNNGVAISLDTDETELVKKMYWRNLVSNHIQQFRKEMGLHMWNEIQVYFKTEDDDMMDFLLNSIDDFDTILVNKPIVCEEFNGIQTHIKSAITTMELEKKEIEIMIDVIKE